jgi:uncharacterized membrane protein
MSTLPNPRKKNGDVLLFIAFVVFVVFAVGSMMAINYYGEKRFGDAAKVHDAADH